MKNKQVLFVVVGIIGLVGLPLIHTYGTLKYLSELLVIARPENLPAVFERRTALMLAISTGIIVAQSIAIAVLGWVIGRSVRVHNALCSALEHFVPAGTVFHGEKSSFIFGTINDIDGVDISGRDFPVYMTDEDDDDLVDESLEHSNL